MTYVRVHNTEPSQATKRLQVALSMILPRRSRTADSEQPVLFPTDLQHYIIDKSKPLLLPR